MAITSQHFVYFFIRLHAYTNMFVYICLSIVWEHIACLLSIIINGHNKKWSLYDFQFYNHYNAYGVDTVWTVCTGVFPFSQAHLMRWKFHTTLWHQKTLEYHRMNFFLISPDKSHSVKCLWTSHCFNYNKLTWLSNLYANTAM